MDALTRGHPNLSWASELRSIEKATISALKGRDNVRVLEIGPWMGCVTVALARIVRDFDGKVFCCDAWRGTPADDLSWISRHRDIFAAFWRRICRAGLQDIVIPMRGLSQDVMPVLASGSFDFVYIDGDHRYEGVKHDIEQARRLIKRGGMIAGHDYDDVHPDVMRAVDEAFGIPEHVGRVWDVTIK